MSQSEAVNEETIAVRAAGAQYRAVQNVVTAVVHDVNNVLSILMGSTEILQDLVEDEEPNKAMMQKSLATLNRNLSRIQNMMVEIRKIYRPGGDGEECTQVNDIIKSLLAVYDYRLKKHRVQLNFEDLAMDRVQIPTAQFSMIFSVFLENIIDQAAEHAKEEVHAKITFDESKSAIVIASRGGEFSALAKEKLGQPFVTGRDPDRHLGLGISMAKTLLRTYGGDLSWDLSGPEYTFYLKLPC